MIMEFAILLHLLTGVYMISNPDIFTYKDIELYDEQGEYASELLNSLFGLEPQRFQQPHTVIYMGGILIFILCFILERCCGFMTKCVKCFCCGCLPEESEEVHHSSDIYEELSPEDQQHEFFMTNRKIKKNHTYLLEHQNVEETSLMEFYEKRLKLK